MTPTTYGRDFAYCLKSHGGVRGFNASLWRFLLRCTLFCHSVATFLTSVSSYEGGCGFEVFYCIRGGTEHNVRDNDVCVRCENKREGRPNCCGRKCYERGCCGQRRRGRRRRARTPIPPAEDSAGAVRIFYCIRVETAHNVRSDGSCARREKKKGRGVSPLVQVLGTLIQKLSCAPAVSHP